MGAGVGAGEVAGGLPASLARWAGASADRDVGVGSAGGEVNPSSQSPHWDPTKKHSKAISSRTENRAQLKF